METETQSRTYSINDVQHDWLMARARMEGRRTGRNLTASKVVRWVFDQAMAEAPVTDDAELNEVIADYIAEGGWAEGHNLGWTRVEHPASRGELDRLNQRVHDLELAVNSLVEERSRS